MAKLTQMQVRRIASRVASHWLTHCVDTFGLPWGSCGLPASMPDHDEWDDLERRVENQLKAIVKNLAES